MRIELVTTGLDIGGAEVQVRDLALGLKARGHDVGIVSLLAPRAFSEQLEAAGIVFASMSRQDGRTSFTPIWSMPICSPA
jgi:UDP:flavonoid glycosyltransferase YjiC (YdhE family)